MQIHVEGKYSTIRRLAVSNRLARLKSEKIQVLIKRKTSLADKFINSNNPFKEITKEEILDLFN